MSLSLHLQDNVEQVRSTCKNACRTTQWSKLQTWPRCRFRWKSPTVQRMPCRRWVLKRSCADHCVFGWSFPAFSAKHKDRHKDRDKRNNAQAHKQEDAHTHTQHRKQNQKQTHKQRHERTHNHKEKHKHACESCASDFLQRMPHTQ